MIADDAVPTTEKDRVLTIKQGNVGSRATTLYLSMHLPASLCMPPVYASTSFY